MQVGEIQNPGLGEFKIRDLNDEINKSLREKTHWDKRIIELGGPNYLVSFSPCFASSIRNRFPEDLLTCFVFPLDLCSGVYVWVRAPDHRRMPL